MSRRSWPRQASRRTSASRPTPLSPAAASGTPKPTRPTPGTCGSCWPTAGCRSAGSRRRRSWSAGRCWRPTTTCAASTPPGYSGSTRCSSTRARRGWARARCAPNAAWPRCGRPRPRTCPRPGSCRWPPRWTCSPPSRPGWTRCAGSCGGRPPPHRRPGARGPAVRRRAADRAGDDLLARQRRPVFLQPQGGPVRRAGCHRLLLRRQALARAPVPPGPEILRWVAYGAGKALAARRPPATTTTRP